ncbi:MAG TPA: nuclear transport factor 2 family protein [Candidatus Brocadiia bacterium]|nr:nuclear transport factor 2 family protein [Candidatus Brocadiia bacterium]
MQSRFGALLGARMLPLVAIGIIVALILGKLLIPTDESRVKKSLMGFIHCVEDNDAEMMMAYISDNYDDGDYLRGDLKRILDELMDEVGPLRISLSEVRVDVDGDEASVVFSARGTTQEEGHEYYGLLRSAWRMTFRRENRMWHITSIAPIRVANINADSLKELYERHR